MKGQNRLAAALVACLLIASCGGAPAATPVPKATATSAIMAASPTPMPSGQPAPTIAPPKGDGEPVRGGTLRYAVASIIVPTDPHITAGAHPTHEINGVFSNNMVRMDLATRSIVPELAESFDYKSPLEVVYHLRKGIHFQKQSLAAGRELDADDVVMTFSRSIRKELPVGSGRESFTRVVGYKALDKYTVQATFSEPFISYLEWRTVANLGVVVPREFDAKYPFPASWSQTELWAGTGPFLFDAAAYRPEISGAGNRNPNYEVFPGMPYVDRVEWLTIPDQSSRSAAVRTRQVQVAIPPNSEKPKYVRDGFQINTNERQVIANQGVTMNTQVYPTNDWRFRKAIHMGLDREALRQVVADGWGCTVMVLGCVPGLFLDEKEWAGKPGFRTNKEQDYTEARALLKEMNYDFSTKLYYTSAAQNIYREHFEQAIAIVQMLRQNLGLNIEHVVNPPNNRSTEYFQKTGHHFHNFTAGGPGSHISEWALMSSLHSKAPWNVSLWFDPKTDEMIRQQSAALDPKERKKILNDIQRYILEDKNLPIAPNIRAYNFIAAAPNVRGYHPDGFYITALNAWEFQHTWLVK